MPFALVFVSIIVFIRESKNLEHKSGCRQRMGFNNKKGFFKNKSERRKLLINRANRGLLTSGQEFTKK